MCTITINGVIGIGADPTFIRVNGTVVDCAADVEGDRVIVSIACENSEAFATGAADVSGEAWVILLPVPADSDCGCGRPVFVTARCISDDSCAAPPFGVSELRCLECPNVSGVAPEPGEELVECNPDGSASVTLEALVDNVTAGHIRAFIECGTNPPGQLEAPNNFIELAPGGIGVVTATCNYDTPSTPTPFVRFTDLSGNDLGCPEIPIAFGEVDCPCPEVVGLTVTVEGCTASFEGTLSSDEGGCSFIWDFGDGSSDVQTDDPKTTHTYPCAGTYAAVVTARCGEGCSETTTAILTIEEDEGCPPCRGACCLPNGSCVELTEDECLERGGDYRGHGTECAEVECGDDGDGGNGREEPDDCWWCPWLCGALLVLGLAAVLAAVVLFVIAGCQNFMTPWVWGAAAVLAVLGLAALGAWALLCKKFVDCDTLCTIITTVKIVIVVQAAIVAVLSVLVWLGIISSWGCVIGIISGLAYLGLVLVILLQVNDATGCGCENSGA